LKEVKRQLWDDLAYPAVFWLVQASLLAAIVFCVWEGVA